MKICIAVKEDDGKYLESITVKEIDIDESLYNHLSTLQLAHVIGEKLSKIKEEQINKRNY